MNLHLKKMIHPSRLPSRLRQPHLIPSSAGWVPTRPGTWKEIWMAEKGLPLNKRKLGDTVDGRNPAPVEVGSLSHYLQGFIHPRWCRISSINSMESLKMKKSWWWVLLERGTTEVYKPFKEGKNWQLVSNMFVILPEIWWEILLQFGLRIFSQIGNPPPTRKKNEGISL